MFSWGLLAASVLLTGCSRDAAGDAPTPARAEAPAPTETPPAREDACALLSLAEIRRVLPEASRAERNDKLSTEGINGCGWYGAGKSPLIEVSVWQVSGEDDTAMENARTLAMGIADPTRADGQDAVRLEKIAGIGDEAVAMVEKSDASRGILTTSALLTLQKNGRIALVASVDMANADRTRALEQLTTLGKAVAARL
jgi:hypothetical protein